jgi:hypothetical protein
MLLRISSRLTAQHILSLFLTPFCHLDQTLALPRACIFAELDNKGAAGKASPGSRPIRSLTSTNDEATSSRWRSRQNVRCFPMAKSGSLDGWENSRIFRRVLGTSIRGIWIYLPVSLRLSSPGQAYGRFVHALILRYARREQAFTTFFLRNKAELELMRRLLDRNTPGSSMDIADLGCSKGAEVCGQSVRHVRT